MLKSTAPAAVVEQDPLEYYDLLTAQIEVLQPRRTHKYPSSPCLQPLRVPADRPRRPQHGADRVSRPSHLRVPDRGVEGQSVQHHRAGRAGVKGHALLRTDVLLAWGDGVAEEAEE